MRIYLKQVQVFKILHYLYLHCDSIVAVTSVLLLLLKVTPLMLNIKLCSLVGLLGCGSKKTHSYMLKFLKGSDFTELGDHLDVLLSSLEPGACLYHQSTVGLSKK